MRHDESLDLDLDSQARRWTAPTVTALQETVLPCRSVEGQPRSSVEKVSTEERKPSIKRGRRLSSIKTSIIHLKRGSDLQSDNGTSIIVVRLVKRLVVI